MPLPVLLPGTKFAVIVGTFKLCRSCSAKNAKQSNPSEPDRGRRCSSGTMGGWTSSSILDVVSVGLFGLNESMEVFVSNIEVP